MTAAIIFANVAPIPHPLSASIEKANKTTAAKVIITTTTMTTMATSSFSFATSAIKNLINNTATATTTATVSIITINFAITFDDLVACIIYCCCKAAFSTFCTFNGMDTIALHIIIAPKFSYNKETLLRTNPNVRKRGLQMFTVGCKLLQVSLGHANFHREEKFVEQEESFH